MQTKRIAGLLVAGLLVASMAAACSSSKKSSVSAGANQSTTTTAKSSSGSGSGGGSSSGIAGALTDSECVQAGVAYARMLTSSEAALTGNKTDASQLNADYSELGGKIPSNLKSQYKTVGDAYAQFAKDVKGASLTDPSSYEKAANDLDTPAVKAASQKIQTYFNNHCKD